jgi:hypothetical protein
VPGWVMLLEYGSIAVTFAVIWLRRFKRPTAIPGSTD